MSTLPNEFFKRIERTEHAGQGVPEPKFIDGLGSCCHCEKNPAVAIIMLPKKAPIAGRGWGNPRCPCNLPPDGALAVLCEKCRARYETKPFKPRYACRGYPATDGRIPYPDLRGRHGHDKARHCLT